MEVSTVPSLSPNGSRMAADHLASPPFARAANGCGMSSQHDDLQVRPRKPEYPRSEFWPVGPSTALSITTLLAGVACIARPLRGCSGTSTSAPWGWEGPGGPFLKVGSTSGRKRGFGGGQHKLTSLKASTEALGQESGSGAGKSVDEIVREQATGQSDTLQLPGTVFRPLCDVWKRGLQPSQSLS